MTTASVVTTAYCVSGDHCVSGFGASLNGEGVSAAGRREAEFRAGIRVR